MAKQKLRWDFPPLSEIHEEQIFIDPKSLQLLPAPIVVRNCLHGYDDQGELRKILYCSRDVRFFTRAKDGWHEQQPSSNRVRRGRANGNAKAGGGFDTAYMRAFGAITCYRLIAYAFCEWPKEAETDPLWYKRYEVDHLNGNHSDSSPENLRWVTPAKNRKWDKRCGREQYKDGAHKGKTLRGIALDPKRINYDNLRRIANLSDHQFEAFLIEVQETMKLDLSPLSVETINRDITVALDVIVHFTDHCNCCYDELYT